jgi:hypothetical protein
MTELPDGLGLDLTDTFAGDAEFASDLLEGAGAVVV